MVHKRNFSFKKAVEDISFIPASTFLETSGLLLLPESRKKYLNLMTILTAVETVTITRIHLLLNRIAD